MKTKIGMTFGLALMLAFGVVATMLAIGSFSTGTVEAGHLDDGTSGWGDAGTTTGENVTSATWTATPNDPGAESKIELVFTTYSQLDALTDTIIIEFDDDFGVPTVIDPSTVTIQSDFIENPGTDVTGNAVAYPLDVTTELVGTPADETLVTLTVPDMDPTTSSPSLNHITSGSQVTVTFKQTAGITNPTEAKDTTSTGFKFYVSTSDKPEQVQSAAYAIPRQVKASATTGERGKSITITGKGFENGTTATVWLDYNRDGAIDSGETTLTSATVESDNTFSAAFEMAKPPFVRSSSSKTDDGTNYNAINAIDGEGNTIVAGSTAKGTSTHVVGDLPLIGYEGRLSVTPTTAAVGDTITVTLEEFDASKDIDDWTTATIGTKGLVADGSADNTTTTDSNGDVTFNFTVPNGLPAGVHSLEIDTGSLSGTEVKDITVTGAVMTLTPESVVPNQTVTVIGTGFSTSVTINSSSDASIISLGGSTTDLKAASGTKSDKFNENASITTDDGGNWSASLIVPTNTTTVNDGVHELKVKDAGGRDGVVNVTLADRTVTLSPSESRIGETVTVTGSGFPADNTKSGAETTPAVSIVYVVGSTSNTVATLTPDASGNVSGSFKVPLSASIPSTNSVRAEFTIPGTTTTVTTATTHEVPKAVVSLSSSSGPSGVYITLTGTGFKAHSTVSDLELGGIDVKPAPVPATGSEGAFSAEVLVPELNNGAHTVKATISSTTASTTFTVTDEPLVTGPTDSATYFAPIIDNDDNLVRVFRFDNASQSWSFFDPLPAFASVNELTTVTDGDIVWIRINEAQDFEGIALVSDWNLVALP